MYVRHETYRDDPPGTSSVTLHEDRSLGEAFIVVYGDPTVMTWARIRERLKALSIEVLPEWECLSEELEDGGLKIWCTWTE